MNNESHVDRVNEPIEVDVTIMYWIAKLSKMYTSKKRPTKASLRSRARNIARGGTHKVL